MSRTIREIWAAAVPETIRKDAEEAASIVSTAPEEDQRYMEGLYMIWSAVYPEEPFPGSPAALEAAEKR